MSRDSAHEKNQEQKSMIQAQTNSIWLRLIQSDSDLNIEDEESTIETYKIQSAQTVHVNEKNKREINKQRRYAKIKIRRAETYEKIEKNSKSKQILCRKNVHFENEIFNDDIEMKNDSSTEKKESDRFTMKLANTVKNFTDILSLLNKILDQKVKELIVRDLLDMFS